MRFLVTGATGFVGGCLVRALVAAGHDVTAVVRDPGKAADLADIGVTVRKGDVTHKESMRAPMTGVDGVFHVAGWYKIGGRNRSQGRAVNVDGTRNVLELMRELGVPKGVYTSTLAVFGDTRGKVVDETYRPDRPYITEYDRTKAAAHFEVAEPLMRGSLPLVIVQPGVIYGPGDTSQLGDAVRRYLRRKLPAVPRDAAYCWAHVDDIVRAHILAMEKGRVGESYIIAGEPRRFVEVLELAERVTGIPPPRFRSTRALRVLAAITRSEILRAAPATYLGRNDKAKRELGLVHRPLEDGLRDTLTHEMAAMGIRASR